MTHLLCIFSPTSCITDLGKSTFNDLFNAVTNWIVSSVEWFLNALGHVIVSAGEPATVINAANEEFNTLLVPAPLLLLIGLIVSTLGALRHGDSSSLWRVYLGVAPACVAGIVLARPMASLVLEAVNQLSGTAASTVAAHETALGTSLVSLAPSTPGFAVFLLSVVVVIATMFLWFELIVRSVVLTLLVVLVPVIVPLATFPSMRRLAWRLAETFVAVAASKLVIVVTLSLGLNELTGTSVTEIVTGAVTLLLATATPYLVLRVVPLLEHSAVHHLDGLRNRATRSLAGASRSPAAQVLSAMTPSAPVPTPQAKGPDLGLDMWPGSGESPMPPLEPEGPPLKPPIGTPQRRKGHAVVRRDEMGPVIGWHWDE
ncbi:MAG TPA: hypothetical protein VMF33_06190 [Acidimicrobiales bacterium]|nr:hypothetical protein [Acidimicrobiales bacterium]